MKTRSVRGVRVKGGKEEKRSDGMMGILIGWMRSQEAEDDEGMRDTQNQ